MTDATEYTMLKSPDDAVAAYREQQFMGSLVEMTSRKAELDALDALRAAMPQRATAIGSEAHQLRTVVDHHSKRVDGLRKLAGITDDTISWDQVASTVGTTLAQEEEILVRSEDQFRNAGAYNMDRADARFQYERAKARVDAFRKVYDDLMGRAGAADDPPKASHRRTSHADDKPDA